MREYWLDPPDYPEPPECPNCKEGFGEYLYDGKSGLVMSCDSCAYQWIVNFPKYYGMTEEDIEKLF